MAAMIESTSRRMSRDRRRLAALRNLSRWQEAARRHAHEMRTPLTGARLELARLVDLTGDLEPARRESLERSAAGIREELERLGRFTEQFTSFARLREPQRSSESLADLLEDFVSTYGGAWPNVDLALEVRAPARAGVDRDMLRQVLANLCDNSSAALADRRGTVTMVLDAEAGAARIDVVDDGGGIDEAMRERLFEPYTTTRGVGEGMGLGLAISKKILLDHDGDLELVRTSAAGTVFRLTLPGERDSSLSP